MKLFLRISYEFSLLEKRKNPFQVRFHPVHDQLLLSAGSDACVVLSCAQSVSSEAVDANEEEEKGEDEQVSELIRN